MLDFFKVVACFSLKIIDNISVFLQFPRMLNAGRCNLT